MYYSLFLISCHIFLEYIIIEVIIKNPMKISLFLGDVTLVWRHTSKTDSDTFGEKKIISNEVRIQLYLYTWYTVD